VFSTFCCGFQREDGAGKTRAMAIKFPAILVAVVFLCVTLLPVTSAGLDRPVKPSTWKLCDKHAKYDVEVKNVTIQPYPAVSGEDVTFIVPAVTNEKINGGTVVITVSFHGVPVHAERNDICSRAECPIAPGGFTLENTQPLPRITPPGDYKIKLQFLGEDDDVLACADITFTIVWGKFQETSLDFFNPLQLHSKPGLRQAHLAHF
jgi:hypothetical protein